MHKIQTFMWKLNCQYEMLNTKIQIHNTQNYTQTKFKTKYYKTLTDKNNN